MTARLPQEIIALGQCVPDLYPRWQILQQPLPTFEHCPVTETVRNEKCDFFALLQIIS